MRYGRRLPWGLSVAVLTTGFFAGPASADAYPDATTGPAVGGYYPDRGVHTYCFEPRHMPGPGVQNRVHYAMDDNDGLAAQTDVVTQFYATCSAAIDAQVAQWAVGDGFGDVYGRTYCLEPSSTIANVCDAWRVVINNAAIQRDAINDGYLQRKTACHELGHSLGVAHYSNTSPDGPTQQSCMRVGPQDTGQAMYRSYGAHHRLHINTWF